MLGDMSGDAGEPAHFCFAKSIQRICHVMEFPNKHDEQKPPVRSASSRTLGSNDVWFVHAVSARITSTGGNQSRRAMQSRDFGVIGYRRTLLCARAGFHLPATAAISVNQYCTKPYSRKHILGFALHVYLCRSTSPRFINACSCLRH